MRRSTLSTSLATLILSAATTATAVDVKPSPDSPGVVIENTQMRPPSNAVDGVNNGSPVDAPSPPLTCVTNGPVRHCLGTSLEVRVPNDLANQAEIRRAVESVGLPALALRIQPGGQTLVNVATIFHTEAPEFRHSTVLLGQAVEITATPARFTWHHGDGTTQTTSTPGAPYPSTAVTHRYTRVAAGLAPRVDVAYRVTYRVNGGAAQEIDQLITASGPPSGLNVTEASPVVVAP